MSTRCRPSNKTKHARCGEAPLCSTSTLLPQTYTIDVKNMANTGEVRHAQVPMRAQRKRTTTKNSIARRLARAQTAEVYASTVTDNKHKKFVIMKQQDRQLKRTGAHTPSVIVAFPMQRFERESATAGAASANTYSMH